MLRVPAVQTGGAAGTSFALVWRLLQSFDQAPPVLPYDFTCPDLGGSWHWPSLVVGLILGLLLGPVLEALCALRSLFSKSLRGELHISLLCQKGTTSFAERGGAWNNASSTWRTSWVSCDPTCAIAGWRSPD